MSAPGDPRADPGLASVAAGPPMHASGEPLLERREDGVLVYADTGVPAPGVTEITLGESVDVRVVARRGQPPEAVLLSAAEVEANPALEWAPPVARRLRSEEGDELEVPWPVWQEHATTSVGVRLAERDGEGLERLLAIEERDLRFARRQLELHAERRARLVAIASGLGVTRRAVGELVGLSGGRIQQLIEDAPEALRREVDALLGAALDVLREIGPREVERDEVALPHGRDETLLDELVAFGLLAADGTRVRLTEAGEQAELHLRTKHRKGGGERA